MSALAAVPPPERSFPSDNTAGARARASADLAGWTPSHEWDRARGPVRFVTSWDTTSTDVERLIAGVTAACRENDE